MSYQYVGEQGDFCLKNLEETIDIRAVLQEV